MIDAAFQAWGSLGAKDLFDLVLVGIVIHNFFSVLVDRFFPDLL